MDKRRAQKRALRARAKIRQSRYNRLTVHRTPQHMYAQVIDVEGKVLVCVSTLDKAVKKACEAFGNVKAAATVGKIIAERAIAAGIKKVAFDRSGFKYHGRVKALAEAAREGGLDF